MAKTRMQKEEQLEKLDQSLQKMKSAVIVNYKGLKVKETEELRQSLRKSDADFHVTKGSLIRLALKNQGIKIKDTIFDQPFAISFAYGDETAPAREVNNFAKKNDILTVLGGILENQFIDAAAVKRLAVLPSREQLYGQIVGTIAAPLSGMVNVLAGNIRGLVNVLNAHKDKLA